mgnify:CR=1 FL=1
MKKLIDFETRKSIHVNMTRNTHSGFRKTLLDYSLSMQEVLEYFASLVAEDDNAAMAIIKDAYDNKRTKAIKKVTDQEADNLYDAIEQEDPFN